MPDSGFTITRLRVVGSRKRDADLELNGGFNVVAGASDTGKSYILQLLNHMMGGSKAPKELDEDKGYDRILMELVDRNGSQYVLGRGLRGGDLTRFRGPLADWSEEAPQESLRSKHDPKSSATVSAFLLSLSGLERATVLMNARGRTRPMSFRDLARFILIDEVQIINERTPVLPSGQVVKKTEDRSVFNILISGEDAAGVTVAPDAAVRKAEWAARRSVYDELIAGLEAKLDSAPADAPHRIQDLESRIDALTATLSDATERISGLSAARAEAWRNSRSVKARLIQIDGLIRRFELLGDHYRSDIERLRFLSEGDYFLAQLGEGYCPVCGSLLATHTAEELAADHHTRLSIQEATTAEIGKVNVLAQDLAAAIRSLEEEKASLTSREGEIQGRLTGIETEMRQQLEPMVTATRQELTTITNERTRLRLLEEDRARLGELVERRNALGPEPKRLKGSIPVAQAMNLRSRREFGDAVARLLRNWQVDPDPLVEFDEDLDIVVSGKPRRSHGKGYRAIIHAAFSIGLMQYCVEAGLPHPGIVALDSPLTSYKPKDNYELGEDIQRAFWENLSKLPQDQQVLVLENKDPPTDLTGRMHYTHFSGDLGVGRAGFYPPQEQEMPLRAHSVRHARRKPIRKRAKIKS